MAMTAMSSAMTARKISDRRAEIENAMNSATASVTGARVQTIRII